MNDVYRCISAKNYSRDERGQFETRVRLQSLEQKMQLNEIFEISSSVTKFFKCNHEKGDTRIMFHALQQKTNVAVHSKDTDVLILMVFAYALNKINEK